MMTSLLLLLLPQTAEARFHIHIQFHITRCTPPPCASLKANTVVQGIGTEHPFLLRMSAEEVSALYQLTAMEYTAEGYFWHYSQILTNIDASWDEQSAAIADVDNDGREDLLVIEPESGDLNIYYSYTPGEAFDAAEPDQTLSGALSSAALSTAVSEEGVDTVFVQAGEASAYQLSAIDTDRDTLGEDTVEYAW